MLDRLAASLGIPRARCAVVGDHVNDARMRRWAGRSFAMASAPEVVRAAARETLAATSEAGGGVAEAIDRWLERPAAARRAAR